ncbi:MAG TPA: hypothetical protein PKJ63_01680 [Cyclobacteriaceae bacterium]|nr:hypothetical protein [Cyclobacteriaceae bacterium]
MQRFQVLLCVFIGTIGVTVAQKADSTRNGGVLDKLKSNTLTDKAIQSIVRKPEADTVFNYKSEDAFIPYEGKVIRRIQVRTIHFNKVIQDTSKVFRNKLVQIGEALHTDTRRHVIRDNLFIKEGDRLNPYRLADNERYLRDLNFIKDSRILVVPYDEDADSVDLLVMTRDVFSYGVSLDPSSPTRANWILQNANILGQGLRFAYTGVYDSDRRPQIGSSYTLSQNSINGTFVTGTVGYTDIDNGRGAGNENESAVYLRLDRPLFMPYARWAGGVEFSRNWSRNVFLKPDSIFARYAYSIQDYWGGFTFGETRSTRLRGENRHRRFLAARVLDQHFITLPGIELNARENLLYSNRLLVLGQLTLFKQNFYKTKYVFGFGRTEDVPYGYSASFTAGWEKQFGMTRPYWGTELQKSITQGGNIITLDAQVGGYFRNTRGEDIVTNLTLSYFSKIYDKSRYKVRHFSEVGYSKYFNRNIKLPFDVNNERGIQGFVADSLAGDARLRAKFQALVFTNWKLLGFNFAVVPQIDFALLSQQNQSVLEGRLFQGYSIGLRTRNENLVFNTVELRGYFYPVVVEDLNHFRINVTASLRIKYPTTLVKPPDTFFN